MTIRLLRRTQIEAFSIFHPFEASTLAQKSHCIMSDGGCGLMTIAYLDILGRLTRRRQVDITLNISKVHLQV